MNRAPLPLLFALSTVPDICQPATDGFFAKTKVVSPFLTKHKSQVLEGVSSPSLCAAETDKLGAQFFAYEATTSTCKVILFSNTMTAFWSSMGQGNYTEVYASWHYWTPGANSMVYY